MTPNGKMLIKNYNLPEAITGYMIFLGAPKYQRGLFF